MKDMMGTSQAWGGREDGAVVERACPNCGMPESEWQGDDGHGHSMDGQVYCCEGCAEGTGCTCGG